MVDKHPGLSRLTKLSYGVGDTGFSLMGTLIGVYYLLFLTDVVGLRPALAGLAILVAKQWDWINDPIIGHLSDRTLTRWGRRRPFLLFGFIPFGIVATFMWWRPPTDSQALLTIYYALVYMLYDTVATFVYMPYFALTPELTEDYDERTSITTYRMAFSILGSLVAFTLPWLIIGSFRAENASRVWLNGFIFAVLSALPLLLTFAGTREKEHLTQTHEPTLRESLRAAYTNRPFLISMALFLLTWLAVDVLQAVLLYFIRYWLHAEAQSDTLFATIFVTALLVLPFWNWVSRKTSKRKAYVIGIAFWALVQVILVAIAPTTPFWAFLAMSALAGIGVSAAHVLPWAMIPDAVEWDETRTGHRHEGMFYSITMLAQKAATGVALFLVGLALDWSGYVANAEVQVPSAITTIRVLTGPVPAVLLLGGIACAVLYDLSRTEHQQLVADLGLRRAQVNPARPPESEQP